MYRYGIRRRRRENHEPSRYVSCYPHTPVVLMAERPFRPHIKLEPLPSSSFDTSWTWLPLSTPRRPQSTVPIALRNVVFDGSREQTLGQLQPGEARQMSVGAVFLAEGVFGFRVAVEEVEVGRKAPAEQGQGQGHAPPRVRFSEVLKVKVESG